MMVQKKKHSIAVGEGVGASSSWALVVGTWKLDRARRRVLVL
jgi:hypothetical protein